MNTRPEASDRPKPMVSLSGFPLKLSAFSEQPKRANDPIPRAMTVENAIKSLIFISFMGWFTYQLPLMSEVE